MAAVAALLLVTTLLHYGVGERCENASAALERLAAESARDEPPPPPPARVALWLDVRHATLHEPTATMRLLADLHLQWEDPRLQWNSTLWGCDTAQTAAESLWTPDLELMNAGASVETGVEDVPAHLASNGTVTWVRRLDATVLVPLDLTEWPRDVQRATFMFASRSLAADQLQLTLDLQKYVTMSESGVWEVVSVVNSLSMSDLAEDQRYVATCTVSVGRRASSHAVATGAVSAATAILQLAAALLSPAARPPLHACAAFITALWLISALQRLPQTGTTPVCLSVMSALCILSGVCCVFAAIVQRVARLRVSPPGAVRRLLTAASSLCKLTPDENTSFQSEGNGAWTAAANLVDYLLIAGQLVTLVIIGAVYMFS